MEQFALNGIIAACLVFLFKGIFFVIAACFVLHYSIYTRRVQRWKASNIPFLRPMFLLGHKYFLKGGRLASAAIVDRIYRENENKDLIAFFMLTTPVVLVKDPSLIRYILSKNFDKSHQGFVKALEHDIETQNTLGFATDITRWKRGRSFMAPVFAASKFYGTSEFACVTKQIDKVLKYSMEAESKGQPIDVFQTFQNFIVDTVSLWGFGEEQDSFQERTEFYEIADSIDGPVKRKLKFMLSLHFPFLQNFNTFHAIEPKYREFFAELLKKQMKHGETSSLDQYKAIDHILSLKQKDLIGISGEYSEKSLEDNEGLRMREMVGYCFALFLGVVSGSVVSAPSIIHVLSLHPEYQDKIKAEIDATLAKHQTTEFTAQVIKDLKFTEQCLLESERLLPLAPFIMRRCTHDISIPGKPFTLRKGDAIMLSPYSMHRDPKYFKDPDKFDPERFSPQNRASIPPEVFIAFGYGPKKCPGYHQGNFVIAYFVAALVQKYVIHPYSHPKLMDATDFHPTSITNRPREKFLVKLVPRKTVKI